MKYKTLNGKNPYKSCPGKNITDKFIEELNVEVGFEMLTSEQKTKKLNWINKIKKFIGQ